MTPTQYDAEIEQLDEQIRDLGQKQHALEQKRAEELCPFKVGDIVERTKHSTEIQRVQITRIAPGYSYTLFGRVLKKDGSLGFRQTRLYDFENWQKVVPHV